MCLPENYQMKVSSTLLGTFCTDDSMVAGMSLAVWNLFKDYFLSLFLSHFALKKFSACLQFQTFFFFFFFCIFKHMLFFFCENQSEI